MQLLLLYIHSLCDTALSYSINILIVLKEYLAVSVICFFSDVFEQNPDLGPSLLFNVSCRVSSAELSLALIQTFFLRV